MRQWLFYLLLILSASGCGYRTPPSPYPATIETLPKISEGKVFFQEDQLILHWKSPLALFQGHTGDADTEDFNQKKRSSEIKPNYGATIQYFRISLVSPLSCDACSDEEVDLLYVRIKDHQLLDEDGRLINNSEMLKLKKIDDRRYQLAISPAFLEKIKIPNQYYLTVDYQTLDEGQSPPTQALKPVKPSLIPVPQVKTKVIELDRNGGAEILTRYQLLPASRYALDTDRLKTASAVWLLNWKPLLETIKHTINEKEKLEQSTVVYGVQFFFYDENKTEINLTPMLLYEGSYAVVDFDKVLYAKHVDRFGNQSASVLVHTAP